MLSISLAHIQVTWVSLADAIRACFDQLLKVSCGAKNTLHIWPHMTDLRSGLIPGSILTNKLYMSAGCLETFRHSSLSTLKLPVIISFETYKAYAYQ